MTGFWFFDNLPRVLLEYESVQTLAESYEWLREPTWKLSHTGLMLEATISVHKREFPVRLVYPALFPAVPPSVRPQDDAARWTTHRYLDGTLCLEWGPDTWRPEVTGAQVLESAHRLLEIEQAETPATYAEAPSRHELAPGQALRSEFTRVYLGDPLRECLHANLNSDRRALFTFHHQSKSCLLVIQGVQSECNFWVNPGVPVTLRQAPDTKAVESALIIGLPVPVDAIQSIDFVTDLDALLIQHGLQTLSSAQEVSPEGTPVSALVRASDGSWHFFVRFEHDSPNLYPASVIEPTSDAEGRLPPDFTSLATKSVAIVGLGSVGSKVAESLARTGVGRFMLLDHDVFLPENVVRNALDLHNTSELKADAVAELLRRVALSVEVDVSRVHLTGQESNAAVATALRKVAECDVVIDATANPRVFNLLASITLAKERPLLWMEVFGGGFGGMVARSRPRKDATPHVIRDVYHAFTRDHPRDNRPTNIDYTGITQDGAIAAAVDAHVGVIADHVTLMALDTIAEREPSRYPHALYLVGLDREWVFEAPFHTVCIETPPYQQEAATPNEATEAAAISFLAELLKEKNGQSAPPS